MKDKRATPAGPAPAWAAPGTPVEKTQRASPPPPEAAPVQPAETAPRLRLSGTFFGNPQRRLALAAGLPLGLYTGTMLWAAHQPRMAIVAFVSALAGGLALEYRQSFLSRILGYILGLISVGTAVRATDLAVLAYAPWTILGAVIFPSWGPSIGLWLAGVASYLMARWVAEKPIFTVDVFTVAAAIGVVHAGAVQLMREVQQHAELALTDPLTGLANRRTLQWRLEEELAHAERNGEPLGLLYLDLNGFKRVNDTFGHRVGDRVLVQVARVLEGAVRRYDLIARVGGDEFVIMAPGLREENAAQLAGRLQTAVTRAQLPLSLRLSLGWVIAPRDGSTPGELLDVADSGLFEQKRRSRRPGRSLAEDLLTALEVLPDGAQQLVHLLDSEQLELEVEEHLAQVGQWSLQMARHLGLDSGRQRVLAQASLLHDVGKLGLPRDLLRKLSPLTPEERNVLAQHVTKGVALLRTLDVNEAVVAVVSAHHERWDGAGYPAGLAGDAIPLEARILAVADSYDAMTSQRVYHGARTNTEAIAELRREAGHQFDPRLVELFVSFLPAPAPVSSAAASDR
jgi:diguanylate cyclase (GGDEF)-like protein/putative nucleotidyltransferase with HDIG domain